MTDHSWQRISWDQYKLLPMREQVRYLRILASETRKAAGPMWNAGKPVLPEDMPDAWHDAQALAERYMAEAARVDGIIGVKRAEDAPERKVWDHLQDFMKPWTEPEAI